MLIIFLMMSFTTLALIYLITGSLYILTIFIQLPLPLETTNLIAFSMSLLFKYNWTTTLLVPVIQRRGIYILFKMITDVDLVIICHHAKILYISWLSFCTVHFILIIHLSCNWKFIPLHLPQLFLCFLPPLFFLTTYYLCLWLYFCCYICSFVLFF